MVEYCMFTDALLVLAFKGMCVDHFFLFFYLFRGIEIFSQIR